MKLLRLAMLLSLLSLLTGCATRTADDFLPEGKAEKARYVRTGKFSSTTLEADKWEKTPERVTAERLRLNHSNAWMPNVEVVVEGYERVRRPEERVEKK
jgi:hypothetical protein